LLSELLQKFGHATKNPPALGISGGGWGISGLVCSS
jgi:hypothetical protein